MKQGRLVSLMGTTAVIVVLAATSAPATTGPSFSTPVRIGYRAGDDWEPSITADRYGHVYAFWTHYNADCYYCFPHLMTLQISADGGRTWGAPTHPFDEGVSQDDPQVVVDPVDGRTVYAAYMQGSKSSMYVARSTDFGKTWKTVLVEQLQRGTDKDILAVRGQDVYLVYNAVMKIYASVSHDGGKTWSLSKIVANTNSKLGWSLPGGGAIDVHGNAYFAWEGYQQNGKPSGKVFIYVSKSTDGGKTWSVSRVAVSDAPPQCGSCGWAFWGPGTALAIDGRNDVYIAWNGNGEKFDPNRLYVSSSTDGARTWSAPLNVSAAPEGSNNVFPALAARGDGDVRIAWMDDRNGHDDGSGTGVGRWNTYYRSSTNGGRTWSREVRLSNYDPAYNYSHPEGFEFPYGDYFELDIDGAGRTHALWGESPSYNGPGNIWYARG